MRILVYPHAMEIGGSQLNAIQLAGAVRDLGHEVTVVSLPGPLVDRVEELGLPRVEIPWQRRRPSALTALQLVSIVRERRIDVVHGYEWPPVVEACFSRCLCPRAAVVGTVLSMSVVPFFPRTVPLVVGSELIREAAAASGQDRVVLIEPPVDVDADSPSVDGSEFRAGWGISPDEVLIAMICRLVPELKLEGLLSTCDAVGALATSGQPVRLVIAGDGPARARVAARAAEVNRVAGRVVVTLVGEVSDPRQAYAAADVIVGQGGSALRGTAFAKPLVVVGEDGFSELLTPRSAPSFLHQGFYGLGPGSLGSGVPALTAALAGIVESSELRGELGRFARRLVADRFSLRRATRLLELEYASAVDDLRFGKQFIPELTRTGLGVLGTKVRSRYQRRRGIVAVDDANARPLVPA